MRGEEIVRILFILPSCYSFLQDVGPIMDDGASPFWGYHLFRRTCLPLVFSVMSVFSAVGQDPVEIFSVIFVVVQFIGVVLR
jgi:hypothetical protein